MIPDGENAHSRSNIGLRRFFLAALSLSERGEDYSIFFEAPLKIIRKAACADSERARKQE